MKTLHEVQAAWLTLFRELPAADRRIDPKELAGPFVSVRPPNHDALVPLVLYVGKATDGCWYRKEFLARGDLEERRERTTRFLQEDALSGSTDFWRFGNQLSRLMAEKSGRKIQALQNLVWTNLSKIGVLEGNPKHPLRKAERDLAIETLRLEIDFYHPNLIVFVTADYEGDLINAAVGDPGEISWHKERAKQGIWWREARDLMPTMLWTYHPERKKQELRELWLQRAVDLFPISSA